mmetsp:Transcript_31926/g.87441  ORF Transcript_31926/g.87441 Transcript_31926/m.87441 type:complete len:97 (-) Transcript_31926:2195-2485(-)|eukprot:826026-Prymnesium_polylepis.1
MTCDMTDRAQTAIDCRARFHSMAGAAAVCTLKHIIAAPSSLRCQYLSRNEFVNDGFYGREAARSRVTEATCDEIKAGEEISLLDPMSSRCSMLSFE